MEKQIEKLNILLSTIAVTKQNVANMHWNVKGPTFWMMHKITEKLYQGLDEFIDEVAEKIAMTNNVPISSFKEWIEWSKVKELESKNFQVKEVIENVVNYLNVIQEVANEVEGADVVQPLLDEVFLFIDKQRWIFKSHQ